MQTDLLQFRSSASQRYVQLVTSVSLQSCLKIGVSRFQSQEPLSNQCVYERLTASKFRPSLLQGCEYSALSYRQACTDVSIVVFVVASVVLMLYWGNAYVLRIVPNTDSCVASHHIAH